MSDERFKQIEAYAKGIWESYQQRMAQRIIESEKMWSETKFIYPNEQLEGWGEWKNQKDYLTDLNDPLSEGLKCIRCYTVSFTNCPEREHEQKLFIVLFKEKTSTVEEVRLSDEDRLCCFSLPNKKNQRGITTNKI